VVSNAIEGSASARPRLLSNEREDALRARLAARDERALVELVEALSPWLLGIAQSMLQDPDEAEEVVLETFRIVWERVPAPDEGPRGLIPWVLRIARNRTVDRLRARRRRRRLVERLGRDEEPAARAVEPDEAAHPGWHVHTSVHQALGQLPEEQRRVVRLAYFEGCTHSEIAARLDLPLGTVKTRLRLGLDRLRAALAPLKPWVL
jgi:RNA polymerase sigma-70 factor (ECF subfamily)